MTVVVRVATRRSALALAQTRMVIAELGRLALGALRWEELQVVTEGDRVQDRPLYEVGGKGLFVKELERALLSAEAEIAVHSMKDLPARLSEGLCIAAVPERASPWDLLVTRDGQGLGDLSRGARVGTTSLRRQIQLKARRPDLEILPLRGNIDTRLRRLGGGDFEGIVLAEAGVQRLGFTVKSVRLDVSMVPAIGQGALAIEAGCSLGAGAHGALCGALRAVEHRATRVAVEAERAVQRALAADCVTPLGAHARVDLGAGELVIDGFLSSLDGARWATASVTGATDDPSGAGEALAARLSELLLALQ